MGERLGQHFLEDEEIIQGIIDSSCIDKGSTVLEIGPGKGALTRLLLKQSKEVIAVEFDDELAAGLRKSFMGSKLKVVNEDILEFDLGNLPKDYIVIANIPYYLTSKLIRRMLNSPNKPKQLNLLIQKEVARRLAAGKGQMSLLTISALVFADIRLGAEVGREHFVPPPKVDSQVIVLDVLDEPLVASVNQDHFFKIVKAGFGERRKKLINSLSGGLGQDKATVEKIILDLGMDPNIRAQELGVDDWLKLSKTIKI